jgi:RimJ/RimL family protein N-acetyltransferase
MILLERDQYDKLTSLLPSLDCHLILRSIVQGNTSATIYVNRASHPQAAFLWKNGKAWLLGSPSDSGSEDLSETLNNAFYPYLREHRADRFRLHYDGRWSSSLDSVFHGLTRTEHWRSHYHLNAAENDWDVDPLPGFKVVEIDEELLASDHGNVDRVREETVSERDTVEDFLEKSFGYAAMKGNEIVSWCMSEYNTGDRCELGIETVEEYQRRGLATLVARAAINHAVGRGIKRIGWHSWRENEPSVRTALRIGFSHDLDYPVSEVKIE